MNIFVNFHHYTYFPHKMRARHKKKQTIVVILFFCVNRKIIHSLKKKITSWRRRSIQLCSYFLYHTCDRKSRPTRWFSLKTKKEEQCSGVFIFFLHFQFSECNFCSRKFFNPCVETFSCLIKPPLPHYTKLMPCNRLFISSFFVPNVFFRGPQAAFIAQKNIGARKNWR